MNAVASEVAAITKKPKAEVVTVTMEDGRKVEFAGKRKVLKDTLIDREAGTVSIRMDFKNGATRTYPIPEGLLLEFAGHGAEQKYGDNLAGHDGSIEDMVEDSDTLNTQIQALKWSAARESTGGAGSSILVLALMEFKGKSKDEVRTFLADKTQADKLALRNHPKIKPIVDRLEAEKSAKTGADAEDLLEGF